MTSTDEVRIGYTFWSSWVRYFKILPFALIVLNTISAFFLFLAFWVIGRHFNSPNNTLFIASAFALAFLIHFIFLYSKLTHFYTLVIGFSMFSLSLSLYISQIFLDKQIHIWKGVAIAWLVLFNPAIHYHVLFYVFGSLILVFHLIASVITERRIPWKNFVTTIVYSLIIFSLSAAPYAGLIYVITSNITSSVASFIPTSYWTIHYASMPLPFLFSLDSPSHVDLYTYGDYLLPSPRYSKVLLSIVPMLLLFIPPWKKQPLYKKRTLLSLLFLVVIALFMSTGYLNHFTFHNSLKVIVSTLYNQENSITNKLADLIYVFINILRQPHRFQFIHFYAVGALGTIVVSWMLNTYTQKNKIISSFLLISFIGIPLFVNPDYRRVVLTGDVNGFLTPYPIPDDLKRIKLYLADHPKNKLFILPSLESGRMIESNDHHYSFLDKLIIYYLDYPTYYYGTGAKPENKITAFLVYRAMLYEQEWWSKILINVIDVSYVLVPKHIVGNKGLTYLPHVDGIIADNLDKSTDFKKVYDGEYYDLYFTETQNKSPLFVNLTWNDLNQFLNEKDVNSFQVYLPQHLHSLMANYQQFGLVTDDVQRSYYDIYTTLEKKSFYYPDVTILPFTTNMIDGSLYTYIAFNMMYLYSAQNQYNHLDEVVPGLINMRSSNFVSLNRGSKHQMKIPFSITTDGKFRIVIRGASMANNFVSQIDESTIQFSRIDNQVNQDYLDFTYYTADVDLNAGSYELFIQSHQEHSIVVEGITVIPLDLVPDNWSTNINENIISLEKISDREYLVTLKQIHDQQSDVN